MSNSPNVLKRQLDVALSNLISMIFALVLGFFATYLKILPQQTIQYFSALLFYFCIPLLLFSEVASAEFENYGSALAVLSIMLAANIIMYMASFAGAGLWLRSFKKGAMLALCTTFSSSLFISLPLVKAMDKVNNTNTAVYCSLAFFLWDITLVPFSVLIFEVRQKHKKHKSRYLVQCSIGVLRALFNPISLPIALGLVFLVLKEVFGRQLVPEVVLNACEFVGDMSGALSVFLMGMAINGKELLGNSFFESLLLVGLKQLVMPLMVLGLLRLAGFTDRSTLISLFVTNAAPPAQTIFLLSIQYGDIAILQVSSCLVLGVFVCFPLLYMGISLLQLDLDDLLYPARWATDSPDSPLMILLTRTSIIMNICTILAGIFTLIPFVFNKTYRVRLRRCVGMLTVCQIGSSVFFILPALFNVISQNPTSCQVQGFGLQFFVSASIIWFLFTSLHMTFEFVCGLRAAAIREVFYHIIALVVPLISAAVPLLPWSDDRGYKAKGAPWCWISNSWLQFALLYIPFVLFALTGILSIIVVQVSERIRRTRKQSMELPENFLNARKALLWKCSLFVVAFSFVWAFGLINRFILLIRNGLGYSDDGNYYLPVWLHVVFSCGQGLLNFLLFGTGGQIMEDYKSFGLLLWKPFRMLGRLPEVLTGRRNSYAISSGADNKRSEDDAELDNEEDFPTSFLFSPATIGRYSVKISSAEDPLSEIRKRRRGTQSLSANLLDYDYESDREVELEMMETPNLQTNQDDAHLKEISDTDSSASDQV